MSSFLSPHKKDKQMNKQKRANYRDDWGCKKAWSEHRPWRSIHVLYKTQQVLHKYLYNYKYNAIAHTWHE